MLKPGPGHPPKTKAGQPDREAYEAAKRELEDTLAKLLAEQGAKVELEGLNSEERTAKLKQLVQQRSKSETERLELMKAMRLKIQDAMRAIVNRSEEHTSELQSLMRISYAVFCVKKKNQTKNKKQ